MTLKKMDFAERNHQKRHKRLVILIEHAGLVATASVCMLLASGKIVGAMQQSAKDLAITPELLSAKWFAEDRVGAPAAPISGRKNYIEFFGGTSSALTI